MQEESLWPRESGGWETAKGNGEIHRVRLAPDFRLEIKTKVTERLWIELPQKNQI